MDTNGGATTGATALAGIVEGSRKRRRLLKTLMLAIVAIGMFSTPAGDDQMAETLKSIAVLGTMGSVADVFIPDDIRAPWMMGTDFKDYEFWLIRGWTGVVLSASTALGLGFTLYYGGNANAVAMDAAAVVIAASDIVCMASTMVAAARTGHARTVADASASASTSVGMNEDADMASGVSDAGVSAAAGGDAGTDRADGSRDGKDNR